MCNATIPGTHNSAIDLADGYGNLDAQFQQYFAWIRWGGMSLALMFTFSFEAAAFLLGL